MPRTLIEECTVMTTSVGPSALDIEPFDALSFTRGMPRTARRPPVAAPRSWNGRASRRAPARSSIQRKPTACGAARSILNCSTRPLWTSGMPAQPGRCHMQALRHTCGMGLCVALYIASPPLVRGPTTKARTLHIESLNALSSRELSRTARQFEAIAPEP